MTPFRTKRPPKAEQVAAAEAAKQHAEQALEEAQSRRSLVEYLAEIQRKRRTENGFGDTFTISMTPRGS